MSRRSTVLSIAALAAIALVVVGCPTPFTTDGEAIDSGSDTLGSLSINLTNAVSAQTLLPDIDMAIESYIVEGLGPDGASFSQSTSAGNLTVDSLIFGQWSVSVSALNADGMIIGSGSTTVQLNSGQTAIAAVTVTPISGVGTLTLDVSWDSTQIQTPTIAARLIPSVGAAVDLTFAVDAINASASFTDSTIPTGYHTLVIQLLDNDILAAGSVQVARIVDGATTSGTYQFANANTPGSTIDVRITQQMGDPLTASITGGAAQVQTGQSLSLSAQLAEAVSATYIWYVAGQSVATGQTFDFDADSFGAGFYNIDLVAFSADGTRAGSAALQTQVVATTDSGGPFVTTWQTDNPGDSADNQIALPLVANGSYDFTVDWGDGSSDTITAWDDPAATHTYPTAGQYTVTITGTIEGWQFMKGDTPAVLGWADGQKLLTVSSWGTLAFGATSGQFAGASNVVIAATDAPDLSKTTSLYSAFYNADSLTDEDFSAWDTSTITDMTAMFFYADSFNGNVSTWDTSSVTGMRNMFTSAYAFNGDLSAWNTSSVTNMAGMFEDTPAFDSNLAAWNTSAVTTMARMFRFATAFDSDLSGWDTSSVIHMSAMFENADAFSGDISTWNTSSVLLMDRMFAYHDTFNGDISAWNTSSVVNMSRMFYAADLFNGDLSAWDTSSVTSMLSMFHQATAFTSDLSGWNTSSLVNMGGIFFRALSFNADLSGWDTSSVTYMPNAFLLATSFDNGGNPAGLENWTVQNNTSTEKMFNGSAMEDQKPSWY